MFLATCVLYVLNYFEMKGTVTAEEHFALIFASILETRDAIKNMHIETNWVIPEELKVCVIFSSLLCTDTML